MPADDPLTERELAFRALIAGVQVGDRLEVRADYAAQCQAARDRWEREHGVEWLHHRDGVQRWLPKRPPLHPDRTAQFRFNPARAAAYAAAKAAASSASMGDAPRTGTHPRTRG